MGDQKVDQKQLVLANDVLSASVPLDRQNGFDKQPKVFVQQPDAVRQLPEQQQHIVVVLDAVAYHRPKRRLDNNSDCQNSLFLRARNTIRKYLHESGVVAAVCVGKNGAHFVYDTGDIELLLHRVRSRCLYRLSNDDVRKYVDFQWLCRCRHGHVVNVFQISRKLSYFTTVLSDY